MSRVYFSLSSFYYVSISCIVLIVYYVSVPRTIFSVFCLIIWYIRALRTVFSVLCLTVCYVSVSRAVFSSFCFLPSCLAHKQSNRTKVLIAFANFQY